MPQAELGKITWTKTKDGKQEECCVKFFTEATRKYAEAHAETLRAIASQKGYTVTEAQVILSNAPKA